MVFIDAATVLDLLANKAKEMAEATIEERKAAGNLAQIHTLRYAAAVITGLGEQITKMVEDETPPTEEN